MRWAKLGEVCEFQKGKTITKKQAVESGKIPVIAGGQTPAYFHNEANRQPPCISVAASGAYSGFVAFWDEPIFLSDAFSITPNDELDIRYLFHWLTSKQQEIYWLQRGAGVPHVYADDLKIWEIPLPGLDEQRKIAQKLDLFEALLKNLETELSQRIKQQRYYSEQLLSPDHLDDFTWHTLGDIGEFIRGNGLQKRDFAETGRGVVHYGQIYTRYGYCASKPLAFTSEAVFAKLRKAHAGDILMATTSENFEDLCKCLAWEGGEIGISGDMMIFRSQQNARFLAHWFASDQFRAQKMSKITGTKVYRVHQDDMKNFKIPLPALEKQREIARVLDLFEALIANIRAELALRSKQARYYREQLLDFTKEQK